MVRHCNAGQCFDKLDLSNFRFPILPPLHCLTRLYYRYGPLFAISSAFVYSCYIVYFKKAAGGKNGEDDRVDIVLFFGLVGE